MKVSEVLKCVASGVSTDEVKEIMELNHTSADEAIELVKAGFSSKTLKGLIDEEKETPPENPPADNKVSEEIEKLKKELEDNKKALEETKADLEKAQKLNIKKDNGPGEKPDPEDLLAKLFA